MGLMEEKKMVDFKDGFQDKTEDMGAQFEDKMRVFLERYMI